MSIDLNCDMGESFGAYKIGEDEKIISYISSANIACGYHAGDPLVMDRTVRLAREHGVAVGAHPGFPDLLGYGRRILETLPGEVRSYVLYQVGALDAFCRANKVKLQHIKPHGALYNLAAREENTAREIIEAVTAYNPELILVALSGSRLAEMAGSAGLKVAREVFPDRAYQADGRLAPRRLPGSVIHEVDQVRERVVRLITRGSMISIEGQEIELKADTLCLHGDTPGAWMLAKTIGEALEEAGITVQPLAKTFSLDSFEDLP
ncbi:MAG TPA: 5-oxoprolinase subunit PxpA [Thermodesulfobacteriota bacterium]|nr:5-oxoprolinase subunit PxpA [Thermodesulfobacteriota bacterium]